MHREARHTDAVRSAGSLGVAGHKATEAGEAMDRFLAKMGRELQVPVDLITLHTRQALIGLRGLVCDVKTTRDFEARACLLSGVISSSCLW